MHAKRSIKQDPATHSHLPWCVRQVSISGCNRCPEGRKGGVISVKDSGARNQGAYEHITMMMLCYHCWRALCVATGHHCFFSRINDLAVVEIVAHL